MNAVDAETAVLRDEIRRTRVGAAAAAVSGSVARAWAVSAARRTAGRAGGILRDASLPERVRAIGLWAAAAAITDGLLTPFDPRPATLSRWALWAGLLVIGVVAAAAAKPVAAAWLDWRGRGAR